MEVGSRELMGKYIVLNLHVMRLNILLHMSHTGLQMQYSEEI